MSRLLARLGVLLAVSLGIVLVGGPSAAAHVAVESSAAVQGEFAEIAFRVPTESDTASTVKIAVAFPADTPIARLSVLPHPGWSYKVTRTTLPNPVPAGHGESVTDVAGQIEWTASGQDAAVKPGEYEVFRVSAGPLPVADRLVFKVVQTYSDGQIVRWIEEPAENGPEPDHPAAVLPLTPAGGGGQVSAMGHTMTTAAAPAEEGASPVLWWALGATLAAVLAALWAVLISVRATRRQGGDDAPA